MNLCLDTGHVSYYGGDNLAIIAKYPDRIGYLHLKQVDPVIVKQVEAEDLDFPEAVRRGVMCRAARRRRPTWAPVLDAVGDLGRDLYAIVEQDMYPCPPDRPLPIARRTHTYLVLVQQCPGFHRHPAAVRMDPEGEAMTTHHDHRPTSRP